MSINIAVMNTRKNLTERNNKLKTSPVDTDLPCYAIGEIKPRGRRGGKRPDPLTRVITLAKEYKVLYYKFYNDPRFTAQRYKSAIRLREEIKKYGLKYKLSKFGID